MSHVIWLTILFVGLLALTGRSYFAIDQLVYSSIGQRVNDSVWDGWGLLLETDLGGVRLEWRSVWQGYYSSYWVLPRPSGINQGYNDGRYSLRVPPDARRSFAGIEYVSHSYDGGRLYGYSCRSIRVPFLLPLLTVFTAWLLIIQLARVRAARRNPFGCPKCGYDLRASKDRCPECGRVIELADIKSRSRDDTGTG
jgi:hypothetical protein